MASSVEVNDGNAGFSLHFDIRQMWFTNMLLLGFDPVQAEIKYKIVFDKDTFSHPRKQAMIVIIHHLFTQLNPQLAYEEFRDCWPVYDSKQDQIFRKKTSNWIKTIAKEEPSYGLPLIIAPLLLSPGGEKFYVFLQVFSSYCLHKVILREAKGKNVFLPSSITDINKIPPLFNDIHKQVTQLHTMSQCNQFLNTSNELSQLHDKWKEYAKELVSDYQRLSKEKNHLENILNELEENVAKDDTCPSLNNLLSSSAITNSSREIQKKKVWSLWKKIDEFLQKISNEREIIEIVTTPSNHNKYTLDGADFKIQNGDALLHHNASLSDHKFLLHQKDSAPINLIELTNCCTLGLRCLHETIVKGLPLPDLSEEVKFVSNEVSNHSSHVTSAQQLKSTLKKHEEKLKERIKLLEPQLKEVRQSYKEEGICGVSSLLPSMGTSQDIKLPIKTSHDLSLLPFSPQVTVGLTPPTSSRPFTPHRPIINKTVASTPRAVENITRTIQEHARRQIASNFTADTPLSTKTSSRVHTMTPTLSTMTSSVTSANLGTSVTSSMMTPAKVISSAKVTSANFNTSSVTSSAKITSANFSTSSVTSSAKVTSSANLSASVTTNSLCHNTQVLSTVNTLTSDSRKLTSVSKPSQKVQRRTKEERGREKGERRKGERAGIQKDTTIESLCARNETPPMSPGNILAEEIVAAVLDPNNTPGNKIICLQDKRKEEEQLAFASRDCIGRTPIGGKVKKTDNTSTLLLDTPSGNSTWLNRETPPTPFNEVRTESPDEISSLSTTPLASSIKVEQLINISD